MILNQEFETFIRSLPELLRSAPGRFVLIRGHDVVGTFPTRDEALESGYDRFGFRTPFLVKAVRPTEEPLEFTRD